MCKRWVETCLVPKRNLLDPQSTVGATAEEFLALKPPGWLVRPLPGGRPGFRMISPDKMPGAYGTVTYYGSGSPDWLRFPTKLDLGNGWELEAGDGFLLRVRASGLPGWAGVDLAWRAHWRGGAAVVPDHPGHAEECR